MKEEGGRDQTHHLEIAIRITQSSFATSCLLCVGSSTQALGRLRKDGNGLQAFAKIVVT